MALSDLPVAVDCMGGDLGISVQVEGAIAALNKYQIKTILVGPEVQLREKIIELGGKVSDFLIHHADQIITMEDSPVRAVRKKPNSSLCKAFELVRDDVAGSVISSGNSGAMMAAGRFICGLIPGIERPAISAMMPKPGNLPGTIMLDAGANVDCTADHLVQFAIMGSVYCAYIQGIKNPRVALLSNGSEPTKGTDVVRAAAATLGNLKEINYIGYAEGRDIPTDFADVVVCDGFVGNLVLKSMEGAVKMVFDELRFEADQDIFSKMTLWLSKGIFKRMFERKFSYKYHACAPLLGLSKLGLVCHGSSDAVAVENAIFRASDLQKKDMIQGITRSLHQHEDLILKIS